MNSFKLCFSDSFNIHSGLMTCVCRRTNAPIYESTSQPVRIPTTSIPSEKNHVVSQRLPRGHLRSCASRRLSSCADVTRISYLIQRTLTQSQSKSHEYPKVKAQLRKNRLNWPARRNFGIPPKTQPNKAETSAEAREGSSH